MRFLYCVCYAVGLGLVAFFLGRLAPKRWFDPNSAWFRERPWEAGLYKKLRLKSWQSKVPDMSRLFPKLMPQKKMTAQTVEALPRMIEETCVAEATHTLLCPLGLVLLAIWPGAGGAILAAVYILFGNLPFILIQRYNRPRLQRLLRAQQRREQRSNKA